MNELNAPASLQRGHHRAPAPSRQFLFDALAEPLHPRTGFLDRLHVSSAGYARASGSEGTGRDIRLVTSIPAVEERDHVVRAAERALDQAGIGVERKRWQKNCGGIQVATCLIVVTRNGD